ncbi:MAG: peptidoglycan recognition protein family protein [Lacrimispora sphenoides]
MTLKVIKKLCPKGKLGRKCPYKMDPDFITIHNTYNDASARNEVAYMLSNNNQTSYHYAVDDKEAVQAIPVNRNAWHAGDGNGSGNRKSIGIEICYSRSGGKRFDQAEKNAAYLTAVLLKQRGWGINRVKRHKDWSGKDCPHRTIDRGWTRFLGIIEKELARLNGKPASMSKQNDNGKLTIDGSWGKDCTRKSQKVMGTAIDGIVSNQPAANRKWLPGAYDGSWEFTDSCAGGSSLVKAIQQLVGTKEDGWCGKNTVKGIQKYLAKLRLYEGKVDGSMGPATVKAWQKCINSRL